MRRKKNCTEKVASRINILIKTEKAKINLIVNIYIFEKLPRSAKNCRSFFFRVVSLLAPKVWRNFKLFNTMFFARLCRRSATEISITRIRLKVVLKKVKKTKNRLVKTGTATKTYKLRHLRGKKIIVFYD